MKQINLLPYREQKYTKKKKELFIAWLSALFLCIGIIYLSKVIIIQQTKEYNLYKFQLLSRLSNLSFTIKKINQLKREMLRLENNINIIQGNHEQLRKILDFIVYLKYLATPELFIRFIDYHTPYLIFYMGAASEKQSLVLIKKLQLKYKYHLKWRFINKIRNSPYDFVVTMSFK